MISRLLGPHPGRRFWGGFGSFAARGIVAASGGGGAAFDYAALSSLIQHIDMDDASLDGSSKIQSVADRTSEGNNLTQTTAADRPARTAGWLNGKAAALGSGTTEFLIAAAFASGAISTYTIYLVGDWSPAAGNSVLLDHAGTTLCRQAGGTTAEFGTSSGTLSSAEPPDSTPFIWEINATGASDSSFRIEPAGGTVRTATGTLGGSFDGYHFMSNRFGSAGWTDHMAKILLFNTALPLATREQIRAQLATEYNIVHA